MEPNTQEKSNGALLGLVVIVIILIIGGIYIWQSKLNKNNTPIYENGEFITQQAAPQVSTVTAEDASDLDQLDQDLQSADTDAELDVNNLE